MIHRFGGPGMHGIGGIPFVSMGSIGQVAATTLVLQPDAAAGIDTFIYANGAGNNYGIFTNIQVGGSGAGRLRALLMFSGITAVIGKTIVSAILELYCQSESDTTDYAVKVHRALTQWYEGIKSGAAPGATDGSTWNQRNANTGAPLAWAGGVGGGAGSDYAVVATDSTIITAPATWFAWDVTADVAAWAAGTANYGWFLLGDETAANSGKVFTSSDGVTPANRPKLTIVYS